MAWLRRGQILLDRYRVEETLGTGGMGTVVAAMDLRRAQRVALKVAHRGDGARFVREAEAARLTSPHVARILDTGLLDGGVPFIALEYLEGADLATWLAARGSLPIATAATVIVQACHAIAEAHAFGIVHRDLKPANLFLTTSASVKVLDFGIAKHRDDSRITATGGLVGSPAYMPPEQMRPSTVVDARGDIWSLGIVLFEAVSGRLPFESEAFPDLCLKIMLDDMPPLDAPEGFAAIVRRCLEKDPESRYQSAAALAEALAPFAESVLQISALELELLVVEPHDDDGAVVPSVSRRRAPWSVWAATLAVLWSVPEAGPREPATAPAIARPTVPAPQAPPAPRVVPIAIAARPVAPAPSVPRVARHPDPKLPVAHTPATTPIVPQSDERIVAAPHVTDPLASPF